MISQAVGFYGRQVCLNGHVITSYVGAEVGRARMQNYCVQCGEGTITACPGCGVVIRGLSFSSVQPDGSGTHAQPYCHGCGKPYPWTERHLSAAAELIAEDELLAEADKRQLNAAIAEMTSENPRTNVGATRFKRIVLNAGQGVREALQKTIVDVVSETAKKIIMG